MPKKDKEVSESIFRGLWQQELARKDLYSGEKGEGALNNGKKNRMTVMNAKISWTLISRLFKSSFTAESS